MRILMKMMTWIPKQIMTFKVEVDEEDDSEEDEEDDSEEDAEDDSEKNDREEADVDDNEKDEDDRKFEETDKWEGTNDREGESEVAKQVQKEVAMLKEKNHPFGSNIAKSEIFLNTSLKKDKKICLSLHQPAILEMDHAQINK